MIKTKSGFTLAEVLTTLMVIGVVAAMTIPTLMNSTNDQQYKVAFKKAMSILSQGSQLMIAKEEQCAVTSSAELASCFKSNVLTGELVDQNGSNAGSDKNVIKTGDGIAYAFYYTGPTDIATSRSLEEICGTIDEMDKLASGSADGSASYNGTKGRCFVVVDLNGLGKGSKAFTENGSSGGTALSFTGTVTSTGGDAILPTTIGSDQAAMIITGDGVRPTFVTSATNAMSRGYKYMYGEDVNPLKDTTTTTPSS